MAAVRRLFLRLAATLNGRRADADLAREIDAHLQLLQDRYRAQGMNAPDARLAARRAFGGVVNAKESQREARAFQWLSSSLIDFKLGARMLVKYPGLTLVSGIGLAVVTAMAAMSFRVGSLFLDPSVPLEEGDRIVSLQYWDPVVNDAEPRVLHDFITWRDTLRSVVDVGAFRQVSRNLIAADTSPETVNVAEITASGFRVARVPPFLGRPILDTDERPGAPSTLVLGYDIWQRRFSADPQIVGKTVQLGSATHTVVGVMPEGFAFPIANSVWVPLRLEPSRYELRKSPQISIFARLAPGATREQAQAELTTVAARTAAASPATHRQLVPQVIPYTYSFSDMEDPSNAMVLHIIQWLVVLLVVVVCVNVASLIYARTAAREDEIAVRTALGAGRGRIVAQLFLEALLLSMVAATAGLALAAAAFRAVAVAVVPLAGRLPFWMDLRLTAGTGAYVMALTVLAAAIVGAVPALKATGRGVQNRLQGLSRGGGTAMRLGWAWTALIVAQVAFTVALLPPALFHAWSFLQSGLVEPPHVAREFMTAQLVTERLGGSDQNPASDPEFMSRYKIRHGELMRRLLAEPGVDRATYMLQVPGEERLVWVEVEGAGRRVPIASQKDGAVRAGTLGHEARYNRVEPGFFDTFGVPVLRGRALNMADTGSNAAAVVVNRSFAQQIGRDTEVIGRHVRYVGRSGDVQAEHVTLERWYDIVGVVGDTPVTPPALFGNVRPRIYHAAAPGEIYPVTIAAHVSGGVPGDFAPRLRAAAASVDPTLQLRNVLTIDEVLSQETLMARLIAAAIGLLTVSVIALSAAGIYALMSFTVARRRREIGIHTALGARPHRILTRVLSRAFRQIAVGAALGLTVAVILEQVTGGELMNGRGAMVLPLVALLMMAVGLGAALGPALQGLRIDPAEALRDE